jgi:hypothetical protein
MFICTPRFWLASVITGADVFLRHVEMHRDDRLADLAIRPTSGILDGFSTMITSPSS